MNYKFNYTLDDSDYLEYTRHYYKTSPIRKKSERRSILGVLLIGMGWLSTNILLKTDFHTIVKWGSILALIVIVLFIAPRLFSDIIIQGNIKAMKKQGKLPYPKNMQMHFDDDSLYYETETGCGNIKYSSVEKVEHTTTAIYIFTNVAQALILPFSVFESDVQRSEFMLNLYRSIGIIQ